MKLTEAVEKYHQHLTLLNYAVSTRKATADWLRRFVRFCEAQEIGELAAVTDDHLAEYQRQMMWEKGRVYSPATLDMALRTVRYFFRWATKSRILMVDPTRNLVLRRVTPMPRPVLSIGEVERLLAVPNVDDPGGLRDRAVLETLYATGIRRAECHKLNVADVDFDNGTLLVRQGKGSRWRIVPLGEALTDTLQRYLTQSRHVLCRDVNELALFVSKLGTRYSNCLMNQMMVRVCRSAQLPLIGCHGLRHAFAAHLMANGAELRHIQALLGHQWAQTTEVYTRLFPVDLAKEYGVTHPRARKPQT